MSHTKPQFTFYANDYFADLIARLRETGPGDRVTAVTMICHATDPGVRPLIDALIAAARRGADVTLITDAYQFIKRNSITLGPLYLPLHAPSHRPSASRAEMAVLDQLTAAGGRYSIINAADSRFTNYVKGRSHIKFTLINDRVYLGSANLEAGDRLDLMVAWDDAHTADWLRQWSERVIARGATRPTMPEDLTVAVSPSATLLVDAGAPGRSLIMDQSLKLIDEAAEQIFIATQLFPGGVVARHLFAAHRRGVRITIVFNHPSLFKWPDRLAQQVYQLAHRQYPASFFSRVHRGPSYLHVKILASEQAAIIGSHNFSTFGVSFGTAETALLVRDPAFAEAAVAAASRQLPDKELLLKSTAK